MESFCNTRISLKMNVIYSFINNFWNHILFGNLIFCPFTNKHKINVANQAWTCSIQAQRCGTVSRCLRNPKEDWQPHSSEPSPPLLWSGCSAGELHTIPLREQAAAPLSHVPGVQGTTEAQLHSHESDSAARASCSQAYHWQGSFVCLPPLGRDFKLYPLELKCLILLESQAHSVGPEEANTRSDLLLRTTCQRPPGGFWERRRAAQQPAEGTGPLTHARIWGPAICQQHSTCAPSRDGPDQQLPCLQPTKAKTLSFQVWRACLGKWWNNNSMAGWALSKASIAAVESSGKWTLGHPYRPRQCARWEDLKVCAGAAL